MDDYQKYIALSRYARYIPEEKRRETWEETVDRYIKFFDKKLDEGNVKEEVRTAILNLEVMPSMRALMTAGPALDRDNTAGFNCAYRAIDDIRAFDEIMYILLCGTGVGFSVERKYVDKLPVISEDFQETDTPIIVADSKIGWAKAFKELILFLYGGQIPRWDTSRVRPAGARLKTFGGRASGPEPLEELFRYSVDLFKRGAGRKLTTIECHDLVCKIASIVVVGGVRRSALLSLSNLTDDRMRHAKTGEWYNMYSHRGYANNSVCYTEQPDFDSFLREWVDLYESKAGERGIFNREAAKKQAGASGRRDTDQDFGTNPCSEIILRSKQFCNLSEVVVRTDDSLEDIKRKVRIATIIGTMQATLTNFRYLSSGWKKNTEEERLLGVSLTGIMDHPVLSGNKVFLDSDYWTMTLSEILDELKEVAIETNKEWAAKLGISPATAITCNKPSGTVSKLVNSSSGIHTRYSKYFINRVRQDKKDPLADFLIEQGVPYEEDTYNPHNWVFTFPQKSPDTSVVKDDLPAMDQLYIWKIYQDYWCEHKPSCSIYYSDDEFLEVGQWVWDNFDSMSGISFMPRDDHIYAQAPNEAITKEEYGKLVKEFPKIEWDKFTEDEDNTIASQEYACVGNACEIV